jgi:hypothetical protein
MQPTNKKNDRQDRNNPKQKHEEGLSHQSSETASTSDRSKLGFFNLGNDGLNMRG